MFETTTEHSRGNKSDKISHQLWKRRECRQLNFSASLPDAAKSRGWKRLEYNCNLDPVLSQHNMKPFPVRCSDRATDLPSCLIRNKTNSKKPPHESVQSEIQRFSAEGNVKLSRPDTQRGSFHEDACGAKRLQRNRSYPFLTVLLVTLLSASHVPLADTAPRGGGRGANGDVSGDRSRDVMDLRCPPCPQIMCPVTDTRRLGCRGGITTGVCGCCPACARLAGERCGGDLKYLGKCDQGLTCVTPPTPPSFPTYRSQREPPGVCVKGAVGATEQADEAFTQKCRPQCTQQFCSKKPRAVCSASNGIAETMRPCQGKCQHTSCRACAMTDDVGCVRCTGRDFRCLKQFGRCVARKTCRGKAGRKFCRRLKSKGNIPRRFVCQVPDCPS